MAKLQFLKGTSALPVSRDANNVYFKLGAAGEGQIALGDNIWNESVQIKSGDNVLAYSAVDGLSASVSLFYDAEGKKIKLVGKEGANLGEIDATAFLKDGMLESASFEDNKLIFVFNTDAGKTQIEVPVADLVDEYTAGNGLSLNGKEFSVKVGGESFLSVDAEGVKLSGVQSAIDSAKAAAIAEAKVALDAANAAQGDVDALDQNVACIDADLSTLEGVVNGHVADAVAHITNEERSAWNAAEANAKDYADAAKTAAISAAASDATTKADAAKADAISAASADATTKADAAKADAISAASADATTKANAAKADAISTAAADATTKANAAKDYADELDDAMDVRVKGLEETKHTHTNKAALDVISTDYMESWNDAATKAHTHTNKSVLDEISSEKVASWDNSLNSAKTYADDAKAAAISAASADATTKADAAKADAISTAASDATTKANAAKADAISTAAADATTKANAAKADAIYAAAADATTKADAAKAEAIADAEGKVNAAKGKIDAYTVNGKQISANPVLNGSEIKLDGYAAVSQSSAVAASDSVNAAIAKLEKAISDVSAAAVKLGAQEGNVMLTIDENNGLSAYLEWGEF